MYNLFTDDARALSNAFQKASYVSILRYSKRIKPPYFVAVRYTPRWWMPAGYAAGATPPASAAMAFLTGTYVNTASPRLAWTTRLAWICSFFFICQMNLILTLLLLLPFDCLLFRFVQWEAV